jgi:hypothetical protein
LISLLGFDVTLFASFNGGGELSLLSIEQLFPALRNVIDGRFAARTSRVSELMLG